MAQNATNVKPEEKKGSGARLFLILLVIILLAVFREILGSAGFRAFVFLDDLFKISASIPPYIAWGLMGLLIGAIYGSVAAWKKYKLKFTVTLIPIAVFILAIVILFVSNKPAKSKYNVQATLLIEDGYNFVTVEADEATMPRGYNTSSINLLDNNENTSWIGNVPKAPVPSEIRFTFRGIESYADKDIKCVGFKIKNGYRKSSRAWADFSRAKEVIIMRNDEAIQNIVLPDNKTTYEEISFSPVSIKPSDVFIIKINSVYSGKKYPKQLAVSELVPVVQYKSF